MPSVLGISLPHGLLARWRTWFAPTLQPFRPLSGVPDAGRPHQPSAEVGDTFHIYGGDWIWLTQDEFCAFPQRVRQAILLTHVRMRA